MDLANALETHADAQAVGSATRLASDQTKSDVRAQVARGRRNHSLALATGVAAGAAVLMTAGAWVAPHLLADPTEIAPLTPPSAATSPTPTAPAYVTTPFGELSGPGDEGYLAPMLGAFRSSSSQECANMTTVPMSQQGEPFPGYVSGLPTWIMPQSLYSGDPIPLYYADSADYEVVKQSVSELYGEDHVNTVALINPEGGWWAFTAYYEIEDSALHAEGIYVKLFFDASCAGGEREYGGPLPPGIYQAREMTTTQWGHGDSVIRDLGPVEVRPWTTIGVAAP